MKFTKMQGCGNNYIYVNCFEEDVKNPGEVSKFVSDVNFGIGSDGLILIRPSQIADCKMSMFNADGSEGKMCGNGIRCVGKYAYDFGIVNKETITVETLSGVKTLQLNVENNKVKTVKVDMGEAILESKQIPVVSDRDKVIDEEITIDGKTYKVTCVSMGNPHCITFVDDVKSIEIEKIGPKFEHDAMFPEQVNTEFIHVTDRKNIDMRVWERGSGETFACGTGACASVVACVLNNLTDDEVNVHLLGGDLFIKYDTNTNKVYMTGPAEVIFSGEIEIRG